jgi:pimeloyl-ACP methyl ester carboxylesterase
MVAIIPVRMNIRLFGRRLTRAILIAAIVCLLFLLILPVWNLAVTRWQHAHNPVPGSFYVIGGKRMHMYCSGIGSPTIVVEAGLGSDWLGWQVVQPQLSKVTRICTYDRSGLGWSEPRLGPRDAETIARQFHALLDEAGVQRPLVLTGHSAGGLYVREYAREFPAEVAGMVLVDSASPQQMDELPGFRTSYEEDKRNAWRDLRWEELRVWSGWERLVGGCHDKPGKGLENMAGQYDAQACRPSYEGGDLGEFLDLDVAFRQAARLTNFGSVPLVVLSKDTGVRTKEMTPKQIAGLQVWAREQEALKDLSPMSWLVIARGSGHKIYQDRPDVVVKEMSRLIAYLRGGPAPPFGSTTVE